MSTQYVSYTPTAPIFPAQPEGAFESEKKIGKLGNLAVSAQKIANETGTKALEIANSTVKVATNSAKALMHSENKVKTLFGTTAGIYKLANFSKSIALGAEYAEVGLHMTSHIKNTASSWTGMMDGIGIIGNFTSIADGTVKKQIQEGDVFSLSRWIISFVGVNAPCTLLLLNQLRIVELAKVSKFLGFAVEIAIVPTIRKAVVILNLMNLYEATCKIKSGDEAQFQVGIFQLASAFADIALQGFWLAGCTSAPGLVFLSIASAGTGIAKLVYQGSKDEAVKGIFERADGINNIAGLISSLLSDYTFMTENLPADIELPPTSADLAQAELDSICNLITLRNIADRKIRFSEEYKGNVFYKAKYLTLLAGNMIQLLRGFHRHGLEPTGFFSSTVGNISLLHHVQDSLLAEILKKVTLRAVGNSFILVSSLIAIGIISQKMWSAPAERSTRNYLAISKEIGKSSCIIFSGSLGIFTGFVASPYFLALSTATSIASLAKTAYDVHQDNQMAAKEKEIKKDSA